MGIYALDTEGSLFFNESYDIQISHSEKWKKIQLDNTSKIENPLEKVFDIDINFKGLYTISGNEIVAEYSGVSEENVCIP